MGHDVELGNWYDINDLYKYLKKKYPNDISKVASILSGLYALKQKKQRLGLYKEEAFDNSIIFALEECCPYLEKKDANKFKYSYGKNASEKSVYDAFQRVFKEKNPTNLNLDEAFIQLFSNVDELNKNIFSANGDVSKNFFTLTNKQGMITSKMVYSFINILFNCEIEDEVAFLMNIA